MPIRPAIETLRELFDGDKPLLESLDEKYNALVREIQATDGKGSITIKLSISPIRGDASMVTIDPEVAVKPPKRRPVSRVFYTTPDGNTMTRNPKQAEIPGLRAVEERISGPIDVDEETGEILGVGD